MSVTTTAAAGLEEARTLVEYRERVGLLSTPALVAKLEQLVIYRSVVEVGTERWALLDLKVEAVRAEVLERMTD